MFCTDQETVWLGTGKGETGKAACPIPTGLNPTRPMERLSHIDTEAVLRSVRESLSAGMRRPHHWLADQKKAARALPLRSASAVDCNKASVVPFALSEHAGSPGPHNSMDRSRIIESDVPEIADPENRPRVAPPPRRPCKWRRLSSPRPLLRPLAAACIWMRGCPLR